MVPVLSARVAIHPRSAYLSVRELADALAQSEGATRRLLKHGLIPGARRIDPLAARSPWLIPPDAPAKYLQRFYKTDVA
jgi:hypothetical protein